MVRRCGNRAGPEGEEGCEMRKIVAAAVVAFAALTLTSIAGADGTETLGPPGITITPAPKVVVAGVGMNAFPNLANSFNVNVPAGATVRQVLLYWEGHWTNHGDYALHTPQVDGDSAISVNGTPVSGTKIGGSTPFFGQDTGAVHGDENFVSYRADITGLNLVHAGASTLTINDMQFESNFPTGFPFTQGNDGAGVVVLYDDGTVAPATQLRDGNDMAFAGFASPLDTTVPQTFTFPPVAAPRSAQLATLAGSVAGPDFVAHRTNQLLVTFDVGSPILVQDPWQSNQGAEFDAANSTITIPANASQMTVQALSAGPPGSTDRPASLAWVSCALSIEGGGQNVCPPGGTFGGNFLVQTLASGDVKLIFDQTPDFNDNTYGTNIVGWGAKAHKFSDLTGSDNAEFQIKNGLGNVVFDFKIDYITCLSTMSTPSKCDSLGPLGGDGGVITGNAAWVLNWSTSLAKNLNTLGFCSAGSCTGGGTDLKLNSPPTLGPTDYTLPSGSPYTGWNFHNVYEVTVSKAAWGAAGFGGASVVKVHNSPSKPGATCPGTAGGLCAPKTHLKTLQFKYTGASCAASNNPQSGKATCSGDPAGAEPVRIIVTSKDGKTTYYDSLVDSVDLGETFTAAAPAGKSFAADTVVRIYKGGTLLQTLGIHTSCSQPIAVGNKFGSLELTAGTSA
jgi:hypothetical protein